MPRPPLPLSATALFVAAAMIAASASAGEPDASRASTAPAPPAVPPRAATVQDLIVEAAEGDLGKPYSFGGRDGRPGCKGVKRCPEGIDCLSLIFFAYEKALGRRWGSFSVYPSISVKRRELGDPVPGLDGVLREDLDLGQFRKGDVLFFLLDGYNVQADAPLFERDGARYGVWHTALVHDATAGDVMVIHARPGDRVVIEPLTNIDFQAVYVVRLPFTRPPKVGTATRAGVAVPTGSPRTAR